MFNFCMDKLFYIYIKIVFELEKFKMGYFFYGFINLWC